MERTGKEQLEGGISLLLYLLLLRRELLRASNSARWLLTVNVGEKLGLNFRKYDKLNADKSYIYAVFLTNLWRLSEHCHQGRSHRPSRGKEA